VFTFRLITVYAHLGCLIKMRVGFRICLFVLRKPATINKLLNEKQLLPNDM